MMIRLFILLAALLAFSPTQATTNVAASVSFSDVNTAAALCTWGDTLKLPAGSANWGLNSLRQTKAIYIVGEGTNLTRISKSGEMIRFSITTAGHSNDIIRVSGICFSNTAATGPSLIMHGKNGGDDPGPGVCNTINSVCIDHCLFYGGSRAIRYSGWVSGVISHVDFGCSDTAVGYPGFDDESWRFAAPYTPGTTNCSVIEDCRFFLPANYNGATQIYNEEGAVPTIRNCQFYATTGDPSFVECHGNQNYYTGTGLDVRSAIAVECYSNYFTMTINNYRYLNFRGGSLLIYSNSFNDLSGGTPLLRLDEEESHATNFFNPLRTVWPAQDQITNSFFFANTLNGSAPATLVTFESEFATPIGVFIHENRDYWTQAPNATNGAPAGVYASYVPLIYPHPLVTYFGGGGPTAPTISSIANQSIAQDTSTGSLPFTIGDASDPPSTLGLSVTSSNHTLADDADCVLGGSGANRTVNITPNTGQTGVTTIKLIVTNSNLLTATNTFTVTVAGSLPIITGNGKLRGRGKLK